MVILLNWWIWPIGGAWASYCAPPAAPGMLTMPVILGLMTIGGASARAGGLDQEGLRSIGLPHLVYILTTNPSILYTVVNISSLLNLPSEPLTIEFIISFGLLVAFLAFF